MTPYILNFETGWSQWSASFPGRIIHQERTRSSAGSGCCGGGRNLLFLREILAVRKTALCVRVVIDDKYWHVLVFGLDVAGCLVSCGDADNILSVSMT